MAMVTNPHNVTYKEYIEISEKDDKHRYEYIDGVMYMMASPAPLHGRISQRINFAFLKYFEDKPCEPFGGDIDVTLIDENGNKNNVIPDLSVVCDTENLTGTKYTGIPTLVVEIVSPSSGSRDYITKTNLYMVGGIKEYIIIDPRKKMAIHYLFSNKTFGDMQTYKEVETVQSQSFKGLEINLIDIFKNL